MNFINQVDLIDLAINVLVAGSIVFLASKILPGVTIKDFWTALLVALVLGVLNALFIFGFKYLGFSWLNNYLSQGLYQVVFNAVLLTITKKVVNGFYLKSFWDSLLMAFIISLLCTVAQVLLKQYHINVF